MPVYGDCPACEWPEFRLTAVGKKGMIRVIDLLSCRYEESVFGKSRRK
jgi:hypothetical protein